MGYNATLVVLTDNLDQIEKDHSFGKKVADAIRNHPNNSVWVTGQTQVISVDHADYYQIVAVGG